MAEPNFLTHRTEQPEEIIAENLERCDADSIYFREVRDRLIALEEQASGVEIAPSRKDRLKRLYRHGRQNNLNADDNYAHTGEKRRVLREIMGYKGLRGAHSLEEASDTMVGEVYQKDFYAGKRLSQ